MEIGNRKVEHSGRGLEIGSAGLWRALTRIGTQWHRLVLTMLFLCALGLRIWGIGFGLPNTNARPDETILVQKALAFGTGDLNPHFFNYPTFYMYALFVLYASYFVTGRLLGIFGSVTDFERAYFLDPSAFYLIGRCTTALMGAATILVVYLMGKQAYSRAVGLWGALLLTVTFVHVRDAHFVATDVPMVWFASVAFVFLFRLVDSGRLRDYVWSGAFAGLACSTKYSALLLAFPLFVGHLLRARGKGRLLLDRRLWLMALCAVSVFFCASPYMVLDWPTFLRDTLFEAGHLGRGHGVEGDVGWIVPLRFSLWYGMGPVLLGLSLVGVLVALLRRTRHDLLILSFLLPYYVVIASSKTAFLRYVILLVPFLCLLAARVSIEALPVPKSARTIWRAGIIGGLIAAAVATGYKAIRHNVLLGREDTRVLAARWIRAHVPSGTKIAMAGGDYGEPRVTECRNLIEEKLAYARSVGGTHYGRAFARALALPGYPPEPNYEVIRLRSRKTSGKMWVMTSFDLDTLQAVGVRFVVTASHFLAYSRVDPRLQRALDERADLLNILLPFDATEPLMPVYDWMDAYYVPLAGFGGIERPGPVIRIYGIR